MRLRQWLKYKIYGLVGVFPYFGVKVHFPKRSRAFFAVCEEGIFESDNVHIMQKLCKHDSYMFDVGANLGLMAIPILSAARDCKVISFEPSPNSLPWLKQTIDRSLYRDRWLLVDKAVGAASGVAEFSVSSPTEGLFDGLRPTGRVPEFQRIMIKVTTLDLEWQRIGCPAVSIIKIDVEGNEINVLRGASKCLMQTRPVVLLEWNKINLAAYGTDSVDLIKFSGAHNYSLFSMPSLIPIKSAGELELQQLRAESFLLVPK